MGYVSPVSCGFLWSGSSPRLTASPLGGGARHPRRPPHQKAQTLPKPEAVPAEIIALAREPAPQLVQVGWGKSGRRLRTVGDVRHEAARLYRRAAQGLIPPEDLSRGIYALVQLGKLIEQADLEERVEQLEAMLAAKGRK